MLITSLSIIMTILLTCVNIFFISKILCKKIEINVKNIIVVLGLSIIVIFSNKMQNNIITMIIQFILLNVSIYIIFGVPLNKCIISVVLFYLVLFICDIVTVLMVKMLSIDLSSLSTTERKLIGDMVVMIMILIITRIYNIISIFQKIIDNSEIKVINYISKSLVAICISYLFLYYNVLDKNIDEIAINITMIVLIICIFIKLSLEKINKQNITKEYQKMNEYVKVYEEIIEKDRIRRHENKNQLITIKGMISDKDKKAHEYIDSLIDDNSDKTYKWIGELKNIPIGGLKGLLFYKVNAMRENNIDVSLTISRSLEDSKLQDINTKLYKQLCQIIGVYVDNAIEACMESETKSIGIEIYKDGDIFEFIITNTYKGNLEVDNMNNAGYTTKGSGHGYGLSLVKDILNSNPQFFQNREMINDYYIQHLFLDLTE